MKSFKCLVTLCLAVVFMESVTTAAFRPTGNFPFRMPLPLQMKRLHHRSAMIGQYYNHAELPPMMYIPGMSTFTSGDTVSTDYINSEPEHGCINCNGVPEVPTEETIQVHQAEELPAIQPAEVPVPVELPEPEEETAVSVATKTPELQEAVTQKTKVTKKVTTPRTDEDDDDDYAWPRNAPGYNVYFPMMFGYPGQSGRSGHENGGYPGGAVAIANSFHGGKGGVATSHATAFGSMPAFKHSNWKRKAQNDD